MDKRKLNRAFNEIKRKANLDYAITNTDEYGDCNTCVNYGLADIFGVDSKGIYAKHWTRGINAGGPWKNINEVYIGHDIDEQQAVVLVEVLEMNGYIVEPRTYDPSKSFIVREK